MHPMKTPLLIAKFTPLAIIATLAIVGAVYAHVALPNPAHAQASPSAVISLSADSVEPGTAITATMSFGNLASDSDTSTIDYIFRADVVDADDCEGSGMGKDRYFYQVDEDPETREATISAGCPAGDYTVRVSLSSAANEELASGSAAFSIAEPTPEPTPEPEADPEPSVAIELSPPGPVGEGAEITVTMSFSDLASDSDTSTTDYVFRADVKDSEDGDADVCEGNGIGRAQLINQVDDDPEIRRGNISASCPPGDYTTEVRIVSINDVEMVSGSANFAVVEPLPNRPPVIRGRVRQVQPPGGRLAPIMVEHGWPGRWSKTGDSDGTMQVTQGLATDPDGDALRWSAAGVWPDGFSIDPTTGRLLFTWGDEPQPYSYTYRGGAIVYFFYREGDEGRGVYCGHDYIRCISAKAKFWLGVEVSDGRGGTDEAWVGIKWFPNRPPRFAEEAIELHVESGDQYQALHTLGATDPDLDRLSYERGGPWPRSIGLANGVIHLNPRGPTYEMPDGVYPFTVLVKDSYGGRATQTITVTVGEPVEGADGPTLTEAEYEPDVLGICGRTQQVQRAIIQEHSDDSFCDEITNSDLSRIRNSLSMSTKGITALKSGDFQGLTRTQGLELDGNALTELPADVFARLSNLRFLYLNKNNLTELPDGVFDGLYGLRTLELGRNRLATIPNDAFEDLANLRSLGLRNNNLTTLQVEWFDGLTSLEGLDLDENQLSAMPPGVFDGLTSLVALGIGGHPLSEPGVWFDGFPNTLKELQLADIGSITLDGAWFEDLSNLEDLLLQRAHLTNLPDDFGERLPTLTRLNLAVNDFATLNADWFDHLPNLSMLLMSRNKVETLPDGMFKGMPNLDELYLDENPGAPFTFTARLEPHSARKFVVKVAQGAPFDMVVELSAPGDALDIPTVKVQAGQITSEPVTVSGDGPVTITVESVVFRNYLRFEGIQTERGEPLVLGAASTPERDAAASTDATLSSLTLSGVDFGIFDPATTGYTASVANDVTQTTVTPTTNDDGATYEIKLGGVTDANGTVSLAVGSNVITIEVTAEDGKTTRTYTVTVNRDTPPEPVEPEEEPTAERSAWLESNPENNPFVGEWQHFTLRGSGLEKVDLSVNVVSATGEPSSTGAVGYATASPPEAAREVCESAYYSGYQMSVDATFSLVGCREGTVVIELLDPDDDYALLKRYTVTVNTGP